MTTSWRAAVGTRSRFAQGLRVTLRPFVFLASVVLLGWTGAASAKPAKEAQERYVEQEITGSVVAYTSRSLSVETARSTAGAGENIEETLVPLDPAITKFERVGGVKELARGDKVRVRYRQKFEQQADGEWRLTGAVGTNVVFLSHAIGGPALRTERGVP